jgi:hypothetical protein
MKSIRPALLCLCLILSACAGSFGPVLGMREIDWLRSSIITDVIYQEGSIKAYRGGAGKYYYFQDALLVKIATRRIPAEQIVEEFGPGKFAPAAPATAKPSGEPAAQPVAAPATQPAAQPAADNASGSLYTEMKQLDALRKEGLITAEEFEAQKKKLLEKY